MDRMVDLPIQNDCIYSALFTPATAGGELDTDRMKELVRFEIDHGVEGFYCCGSSGEGLLLEKEERMKIVEIVAQEAGDNVPFIVHTGALSTREAITLSKHAEKNGASAVSLIPPIYYKYKQEEIFQYYKDVVDAVGLGVIVYNIPQFTGISFSKGNSVLEDEKIIGIKHTSMNLYELERIKQAFPKKMIINGFDEIWLYSLTAGATSTIGTTVNVCSKLLRAIKNAFDKGEIPQAQGLQSKLNEFIETLVNINVFPAAKYCMNVLGLDIGNCRKPFGTLTSLEKTMIEDAMQKISDFL